MKKLIAAFIAFMFLFAACQHAGEQKTANSGDNIEKRVEELLSKMTLDEKIGQMNQ